MNTCHDPFINPCILFALRWCLQCDRPNAIGVSRVTTQSGKKEDKFTSFGIEALPALKVKPPRVKGCTVCIERRVVDRFTIGDYTSHGN
jgi:flavin reductase (DIM6/NTAB) family NADH-FMN oxidoreductase RutF